MAAVAPYPPERLQVIKQIGVDHLAYYEGAGRRDGRRPRGHDGTVPGAGSTISTSAT